MEPCRLLTQSIIVLVKMMNHMLRVPDFSSLVDSAQPTLPAGYSPPIPMPTYPKLSDTRVSLTARSTPTYKEAPSRQNIEHADGVAMVVRPSRESSEDD